MLQVWFGARWAISSPIRSEARDERGTRPEDDDKQYEPTQKKLDDARKKGDLPKSNDLITAGAYAGLLIAAMTLGPVALKGMGTTLAGLLDQADRLSDDSFNGGGGRFCRGR